MDIEKYDQISQEVEETHNKLMLQALDSYMDESLKKEDFANRQDIICL